MRDKWMKYGATQIGRPCVLPNWQKQCRVFVPDPAVSDAWFRTPAMEARYNHVRERYNKLFEDMKKRK